MKILEPALKILMSRVSEPVRQKRGSRELLRQVLLIDRLGSGCLMAGVQSRR